MPIPREGELAPDFTVMSDSGDALRLSELQGRWVALFFYPKDDTPGCTVEAEGFRDQAHRYDGADAILLGISPDDVASHCRFKEKYGLPYTLLADTDHAVAERYGVWREKSMFGRKFWGVVRTTFLIDREGRIAKVFAKVDPPTHAEEVLRELAALNA